ncbi:unnamed protein product [Candidula unifasciata]|uniref:Axonemal dynein light chain domain-containing protein 1 n=1 Tax=Candidula unifasciata TaxID=100452 RepID=A0A8S3YR92_9EUPU|nr:unnamed protein product [Candidula unifasciata]
MLPELRSSTVSIEKPKQQSISAQNDFIPKDILFALTQPMCTKETFGPSFRRKELNAISADVGRPPPASVWNYKRRNRFKHLLDNTPCICGAGKDISFLYDVPHHAPHPPKPDTADQSYVRLEKEANISKPLVVPDSIIPEEYHIVKNKGVVGIHYLEDKYSTQPVDHEKHFVLFPSMNPTSRFEVIKLRNAFESMMDRAGVNDLGKDDLSGPTQMHNLLNLIKKEQNIYNVVFNELIRQITVECAERGELLHLVWAKYHQLLNKVPEQIMSLHEEVIAQRALDLRLTDELVRFKGTIGSLTSELTDVKEHDQKVTKEALKAQEDLRSALAESQKNASLLAEYHDLYELQRRRLERQVFVLSEEKEMWTTAAYCLALKVTEENKLNTARRLQLLEKSWVKLASHFTILLSDRDTDLLTKIQGHVEAWSDLVEDLNISLKQREDNMREAMKTMRNDVQSQLTIFKQKYVNLDNRVDKIPDEEFVRSLTAGMTAWLELITKETDTFGGDVYLSNNEAFSAICKEMEGWTDSALEIFARHSAGGSKVHPEQINMLALNKDVEQLHKEFHDRITGEHGLGRLIISFQSSLETWEKRLRSNAVKSLVLQESDWANVFHVLEEWTLLLNKAVEQSDVPLQCADGEEASKHSSCDFRDVIRQTQKWAMQASNSINSEDAKLVEQVSSLHSEMVRWMVQVLLRLAPDHKDNSQEAAEMALLGSASIPELTETANLLVESLEIFSNYVTLCCDGIVVENTLARQGNREDNADGELNDLKRLKTECTQWTKVAQMLLSQLTGNAMEQMFADTIFASPSEKSVELRRNEMANVKGENIQLLTTEDDVKHSAPAESQLATATACMPKTVDGQRIEVLGYDANTHTQTIEGKHIQLLSQQHARLGTEESFDTGKAYEALAAVETLQNQLIATEERAQSAEERASQAEAQVVALQERIRALEKQIEKQQEKADTQISPAVATPPLSHPKSLSNTSLKSPKVHSPVSGSDVKEEKSGRKSGKSSSGSSRRN